MRQRALIAALWCWVASGSVIFARAEMQQPDSGIHLDVVVTDASGKPVGGLQEKDFKLLDDGKERGTTSFQAYDGVKAKADPAVQMILVVDCLNNGFVELSYIRQGLVKFLRQNGGRLTQPTTIVRFAASEVELLSQSSTDGNALAASVEQMGAATKPRGLDDFSLSMKALSTLMNKLANQPGRKMLIWLGTGWPAPALPGLLVTRASERDQLDEYRLIVQIAKATQDGRVALYGGYQAANFYLRDFLKPVRKVSETDPRDLVLSVLAMKSGGRGELTEINRDSAVLEALNDFVAEAGTFYSFTFDPARTHKENEYHTLKVAVDKPGLTAHTIAGYYDGPEYDRPKPKERKVAAQQQGEEPGIVETVNVAQLSQMVGKATHKRDGEAAKEINRLQLTERLSSQKIAALSSTLPGPQSKAALMAVGDASAFLEPPADEIPREAAPEIMEQRKMMSLVANYLKTIIPKLPNLYADRVTTSFEEIWTPVDKKGRHNEGPLHPVGEFKATVYVRGGKEVVHADGAQEQGLTTRGTFGPILSTVIIDVAHSNTMHWSRWEEGPNGRMAVYRWQVGQADSHYAVSGSEEPGVMGSTAYHGEIGVDPSSGAIMRVVLEADPGLGSSMKRADIMVEYGSVNIGGKMYICPVRSVSYSVGGTATLEAALGMGYDQEVARLNDVVFRDYHVFRSEMRIVP